MDIGNILITKLSKYELSVLVESWDDGSLGEIMLKKLIPEDKKNFPKIYEPAEDGKEHSNEDMRIM